MALKIELRKTPKKNGTHTVVLRVIVNRKKSVLSTDISINRKDFNAEASIDKANWVKSSCPYYRQYNDRIKQLVVKSLSPTQASPTARQLVSSLKNKNATESFFQYFEDYVEKNFGNKFGTYRQYQGFLNRLKMTNGNRDLEFREFDEDFIEKHIKDRKKWGNSQNTISNALKKVRTVVKQAIKDGKMQNNPLDYKLKFEEVEDRHLTMEEIKRIEELELDPKKNIFHVRNCLLFSYYNAGMRISDVLSLKWENVLSTMLKYKMVKTNTLIQHEIPLRAQQILDYYHFRKGEKYVFPFLSNSVDKNKNIFEFYKKIASKTTICNRNLKMIAKMAEIDIRLTCHVSRYTFADHAIDALNGDIYSVSKSLGHSKTQQTDEYLKKHDSKAINRTLARLNELHQSSLHREPEYYI